MDKSDSAKEALALGRSYQIARAGWDLARIRGDIAEMEVSSLKIQLDIAIALGKVARAYLDKGQESDLRKALEAISTLEPKEFFKDEREIAEKASRLLETLEEGTQAREEALEKD